MSKFIDLTGMKYNHLTVIERVENTPKGQARWKCKCDCGNYTIVRSGNLKSGAVKSCGCLQYEPSNKRHGDSKTALYRDYCSILDRCYNPKSHAYSNYGGRGIKVCEEWQIYENFKKWVEETKPSSDYSIDRIDVDGDYSPQNCRWATKKEQARNRRTNLTFTYKGKTQILIEWCEELNLDYKRVHNRITKLGWDFERAISTPVNVNKRNMEIREKWQNLQGCKPNKLV